MCTLAGGLVLGLGTLGCSENTPLGIGLVVASAGFYATYQVHPSGVHDAPAPYCARALQPSHLK